MNKENAAGAILETIAIIWLLAMAFVLFLAPFVVIGLIVMHIVG